MNNPSHLKRILLLLTLSLLILFAVLSLAPATQAPTSVPGDLTTRVAAATAHPTVRPTQVAVSAAAPDIVPPLPDQGTLFFSADRGGHRELYAATLENIGDSARWRQLTQGFSNARAPVVSPDGRSLAFQSDKDGNWEIYLLDLATARITRLTNNLAYDGAPTWSPDSKQLAFESYRAKDMDVWRVNVDGSDAVNLTAEQSAYDFAPTWSPNGKTIAYTSWAGGNKQLYAMSPDGSNVVNLSQNRFHDEHSVWSPDGSQLAFVSNREACSEEVESTLAEPPLQGSIAGSNCQRRGIYVAKFAADKLSELRQVSFAGRDLAPFWSPDGTQIVFLSIRPNGQILYRTTPAGGIAERVTNSKDWIDSAVWSAVTNLQIGTALVPGQTLYVEKPIPSDPKEGSKYDFEGMKQVYLAPSWGILSSAVAESYRALRQRVLKESGVDFLDTLSDMTRLISYRCDNTCDDLSWHKSGRAVDTLLTLNRGGRETVVLVRQDIGGEVYWRVYLRAAKQDGSMGEPLTDAPWNLSANARATLAPGLGGIEGKVETGYFVDFTDLARQYGWGRISSHDDSDFDWRNNREALEYWHFQKEDGLNWYQAMLQVYPPARIRELFDWNTIINSWETEPSRAYLKDIPPAPDGWKWYALVPRQ